MDQKKIATAQKEVFINSQKSTIADLRAQIAGIPATTATVDPLLNKMAESIENEINSDYPFRSSERFAPDSSTPVDVSLPSELLSLGC